MSNSCSINNDLDGIKLNTKINQISKGINESTVSELVSCSTKDVVDMNDSLVFTALSQLDSAEINIDQTNLTQEFNNSLTTNLPIIINVDENSTLSQLLPISSNVFEGSSSSTVSNFTCFGSNIDKNLMKDIICIDHDLEDNIISNGVKLKRDLINLDVKEEDLLFWTSIYCMTRRQEANITIRNKNKKKFPENPIFDGDENNRTKTIDINVLKTIEFIKKINSN